MRYLPILFFSLCLATSLFAQQTLSVPRAPLAENTADLIGQIQDAFTWKRDPHDLQFGPSISEAYGTLFQMAGAEGLRKLQSHANNSTAIQAAWREVALAVPDNDPAPTRRLDPQKVSWFLGFLEGRVRVRSPQWWVESVLDSTAYGPNNICPGKPKERPYHEAGLGYLAPLGTTLKREGDKIVLGIGAESVRFGSGLLTKEPKLHRDVSAALARERVYIATHSDLGYPFTLRCVDRESGSICWKVDVWGTCWAGGSTGSKADAWVSIVVHEDRVVVFGAAVTGIHVEAFAVKDGANLFRFASSY